MRLPGWSHESKKMRWLARGGYAFGALLLVSAVFGGGSDTTPNADPAESNAPADGTLPTDDETTQPPASTPDTLTAEVTAENRLGEEVHVRLPLLLGITDKDGRGCVDGLHAIPPGETRSWTCEWDYPDENEVSFAGTYRLNPDAIAYEGSVNGALLLDNRDALTFRFTIAENGTIDAVALDATGTRVPFEWYSAEGDAPLTEAEKAAREEYLRGVAEVQVAFAEKTLAAGEAIERWAQGEATKEEALSALDEAEAASRAIRDHLAQTTPPEDFTDAHDLLTQGHALYLDSIPRFRACIESDGTDSTACSDADTKVREAAAKMTGAVSEYQEEEPDWPDSYAA